MHPLAQHSELTQWHLARRHIVGKFSDEWSAHAPCLFEFCQGDRHLHFITFDYFLYEFARQRRNITSLKGQFELRPAARKPRIRY